MFQADRQNDTLAVTYGWTSSLRPTPKPYGLLAEMPAQDEAPRIDDAVGRSERLQIEIPGTAAVGEDADPTVNHDQFALCVVHPRIG